MNLPYPRNCIPIVQARAKGLRPADPMLIVCTEKFRAHADDAAVYADPPEAYRWDWLKGLHVVVLVDASTKLGTMLADIMKRDPSQLDVVDVERRLGWLVNFAYPHRLSTVRWPSAWVNDWLGDGNWHREHQMHCRLENNVATARRLDHERRFAECV